MLFSQFHILKRKVHTKVPKNESETSTSDIDIEDCQFLIEVHNLEEYLKKQNLILFGRAENHQFQIRC